MHAWLTEFNNTLYSAVKSCMENVLVLRVECKFSAINRMLRSDLNPLDFYFYGHLKSTVFRLQMSMSATSRTCHCFYSTDVSNVQNLSLFYATDVSNVQNLSLFLCYRCQQRPEPVTVLCYRCQQRPEPVTAFMLRMSATSRTCHSFYATDVSNVQNLSLLLCYRCQQRPEPVTVFMLQMSATSRTCHCFYATDVSNVQNLSLLLCYRCQQRPEPATTSTERILDGSYDTWDFPASEEIIFQTCRILR
jgi:uncharacterized protein with PQ loop repeat